MTLKCPYCNSALTEERDDLICTKCKVSFDTTKLMGYFYGAQPKYILDSIQLASEVIDGSVTYAYGPYNIFEEGFSYEKTTKIDKIKTATAPKADDVLIAYNGILSRSLKYSMITAANAGISSMTTTEYKYDVPESLIFLDLLAHNYTPQLTDEMNKALTAVVAPTPVALAAALLNETSALFGGMSDSEVLFNFSWACNLPIKDFSPSECLRQLAEQFVEHSKFCSTDNLKLSREVEPRIIDIGSVDLIRKAHICLDADIFPGNDWIFWKEDTMQNVSSIYKETTTPTDIAALTQVIKFHEGCRKAWGASYRVNDKILERAKQLSVDCDDPTAMYLCYVNLLSERIEEKYTL